MGRPSSARTGQASSRRSPGSSACRWGLLGASCQGAAHGDTESSGCLLQDVYHYKPFIVGSPCEPGPQRPRRSLLSGSDTRPQGRRVQLSKDPASIAVLGRKRDPTPDLRSVKLWGTTTQKTQIKSNPTGSNSLWWSLELQDWSEPGILVPGLGECGILRVTLHTALPVGQPCVAPQAFQRQDATEECAAVPLRTR